MKKNYFFVAIAAFILSLILFTSSKAIAQDDIFGIKADNGSTKIIKMNFNPNTGAQSGSYSNVKSINYSAALALAPNNYFYYIEGTFGEGDGKFNLWAVKKDGSSHTKVLTNFDANGASSDELGFVRLASDKNGLLIIISKNENDNKIYATSIQTNSNGSVNTPVNHGQLSTSDNSNQNFKNGDLVIDGSDNVFVLANNDASQNTYIYKISVANLSGNKVLNKTWTLLTQSGNKFTERVNGLAWSSTGSLFVSDDENVYFVDQTTVNSAGVGTVKAKKVADCPEGLTDLASQYWPKKSNLPVTWGNISAKTINNHLVVNFITESEVNNDHFELHASNDGINFTKTAELKSKAPNGNSSAPTEYEVTIPLSGKIALGFSVLALLGFGFIPNKKARILSSIVAVISMFTMYSCNKNASEIQVNGATSYKFIRVIQVDKDGNKTESKVIKITKD